ncbi:hypothetical protein Tco_0628099 [Tanacetum coccineum]|uniref:Uncharacterized protein n=1 Tax=Tanacetum coccineum TaxID=301880 RepID=A0ABQ4WPB6_9ASTR
MDRSPDGKTRVKMQSTGEEGVSVVYDPPMIVLTLSTPYQARYVSYNVYLRKIEYGVGVPGVRYRSRVGQIILFLSEGAKGCDGRSIDLGLALKFAGSAL